jgi:hypothetical protein
VNPNVNIFLIVRLAVRLYGWWVQRLGVKWLLILTGLSTLAVLILGCRETY